jgi:hypothetical protein
MTTGSKKNKIDAIESSGVPSSTPVGLKGQRKTAAVNPRTLPEWKGGPVKPGGIGVPPKKPT